MDKMKIKALLPYFGSKRNLAPIVVDLIGKHRVYWEPFCGSMAVLLAKPPCEMETVNDLHGDLINLAKVIQNKDLAFKLYDKLHRTLYSEELFREAKGRWISGPEIDVIDFDQAYDYFVVSWMGINGFAGTKRSDYQFALRWCRGGGQGAKRWKSVVDSMPAWHKRLRDIVIIQRDAFDIISNINDDEDVVIYCDPPYVGVSTKYYHDFEDETHVELRNLLDRFKKARVLVSYYEDPVIDMLYMGWHRAHAKEPLRSLGNATRGKIEDRPKRRTREILYTNWVPKPGGLFDGR